MECKWCFEEVKNYLYFLPKDKAFCREECLDSYIEFENQFKKEEPITAPEVDQEECNY